MKKIILLAIACIISSLSINAYAQDWNHRGAVNVGIYFHTHGQLSSFTGEYGFIYNEHLLLGLGAGVSFMNTDINGKNINHTNIPIYGDIKYYVPLNRNLSFLAGAESGIVLATEKNMSSKFLFYPQVGLDIQLKNKLKLETSFGYRKAQYNLWGLNIGFIF